MKELNVPLHFFVILSPRPRLTASVQSLLAFVFGSADFIRTGWHSQSIILTLVSLYSRCIGCNKINAVESNPVSGPHSWSSAANWQYGCKTIQTFAASSIWTNPRNLDLVQHGVSPVPVNAALISGKLKHKKSQKSYWHTNRCYSK